MCLAGKDCPRSFYNVSRVRIQASIVLYEAVMDRPTLEALLELACTEEFLVGLDVPSEADGSCGTATDVFLDLVELLVPEARCDEAHFVPKEAWRRGINNLYAYTQTPHPWYLDGCNWPGHCVPVVDGWYIDWTARQFDPAAPFPLVFRMGE